jgi:hypothetical protein
LNLFVHFFLYHFRSCKVFINLTGVFLKRNSIYLYYGISVYHHHGISVYRWYSNSAYHFQPYEWLEEFSEIDGWDLQHVRRVKWLWKNKNNPQTFPTYSLKRGDTTQVLDSTVVIDWLRTLNVQQAGYNRKLIVLPKSSGREINFEEIAEYLFDQGVSSNSIESLITEIDELIRIAKWYKKFSDPSEFETEAYLVIPLLRALGWTPQKMAIEWCNVDIALFSQLPREDENLNIVVEAKKRIYLKNQNSFKLHAYFNLTALKSEYPIYECQGIKEALRTMTPEWNG